MNYDTLEGSWKEFKGKVKEQWGKLTNDDLDVINGKREALVGKVQKLYGYTRDRAEREVDAFTAECGCSQNPTADRNESRHL